MMSITTLFLVRGLPGSGKSHLAHEIADEHSGVVFEADQFFMVNGEYRFNPSKLGKAHEDCRARTKDALVSGVTAVVANTFTRQWEMEPYRIMGADLGIKVVVTESTTPWARNVTECAARNTHGVPVNAIQRMFDRWEQ